MIRYDGLLFKACPAMDPLAGELFPQFFLFSLQHMLLGRGIVTAIAFFLLEVGVDNGRNYC